MIKIMSHLCLMVYINDLGKNQQQQKKRIKWEKSEKKRNTPLKCLWIIKYINIMTEPPLHETTCFMLCANNKGADQPVHPRSLISAFFFVS